jgi:hypothetical protein
MLGQKWKESSRRKSGKRRVAQVCCRGRGDGDWVREKRSHMREMKDEESTEGGRTRQGWTRLTVRWCSSVGNAGKMSSGDGNVCSSHPTSGDPNPAARGFGSRGWFTK